MRPFKETAPPPLWLKVPFDWMEAFWVKEPLFVIAIGPPFEVVKVPFWVMVVPVMEIPPLPKVFMAPEMRVVPELACCEIELALTPW